MDAGDTREILSTVFHEHRWSDNTDHEGKHLHVNAVALSQNGRYLAVGYNLTKKHNIINNISTAILY